MSNKNDNNELSRKNNEEELIKRTLMVAAFPALIKSVEKEGDTFYNGFLPGFENAIVEDLESEDECVEFLQDILDDEVEELVCMGKSLPFVDEDEVLLEKYPNHKIAYLDINVYATKEELNYYDACTGSCDCCNHDCGEDYYSECDCDDCIDDCEDDCECGHHHNHCGCEENDDSECGCEDDCDCNDKASKGDNCGCGNKKEGNGCCGKHNKEHECKDNESKSSKHNGNGCKCNHDKSNKSCKKNTTDK